ncbi:MAG TPA: response regulator transcription factor [Cyclobacteriaceae bacterium]|nr:response regulator transcription factor [Cyclobacteriaceae bacterium]
MPPVRTSPARILIADGQDLTLRGIIQLLSKSCDVSETRTIDDLNLRLKYPLPDLFIIDYNSIREFNSDNLITIRQQFETLPIIAITSNRDKKTILKLLESGIHGFLFKDCNEQELIRCVEALLRGKRFFCNEVFDILMEARLARPGVEQWPSQLTTREVDIIRLIVKGHSTSIIAGELNLSPHTISTHRKNIIRKLKIKSPVELVAQAYDLGLVARDNA